MVRTLRTSPNDGSTWLEFRTLRNGWIWIRKTLYHIIIASLIHKFLCHGIHLAHLHYLLKFLRFHGLIKIGGKSKYSDYNATCKYFDMLRHDRTMNSKWPAKGMKVACCVGLHRMSSSNFTRAADEGPEVLCLVTLLKFLSQHSHCHKPFSLQ